MLVYHWRGGRRPLTTPPPTRPSLLSINFSYPPPSPSPSPTRPPQNFSPPRYPPPMPPPPPPPCARCRPPSPSRSPTRPPENFSPPGYPRRMPHAPAPTCACCGAPADLVWTREATARELASWAADPRLPSVTPLDLEPSAAPTTVPVHSC